MSKPKENSVYFVFLGQNLPSYVVPALRLAVQHSGQDVNVIANRSQGRRLADPSFRFIAVEDFYDATKFVEAGKRVGLSQGFRDGFWLKTLERFFVLEQFMRAEGLPDLFHAELDQLLFATNDLVSSLRQQPHKGIFLPFHNPRTAVASVVYCNSLRSLESFTSYASGGDTFAHEMELFSRWGQDKPAELISLPTIGEFGPTADNLVPKGLKYLTSAEINGVVDAAQLGMWIGGTDPRNVGIGELPKTKFFYDDGGGIAGENFLSKLRFLLEQTDSKLFCDTDAEPKVRVYNLHLHSKMHGWLLRSNSNLERLLSFSNQERSVTFKELILRQVSYFFALRLSQIASNPGRAYAKVAARINLAIGRRPSSYPFISGDTFRAASDYVLEPGNISPKLDSMNAGSILFCEADSTESLPVQDFDGRGGPVVLLLGNSDRNHFRSRPIFAPPSLFPAVFAQNMVESIPGFHPLPIGLENAWRANHGRIRAFRSPPAAEIVRLPRIMWNFTISTNIRERTRAANALLSCETTDRLGHQTSRQHRKALARYCFVASPAGNGLDTHRTWEAMYLGCVPIITSSFMADYYHEIGLPVWVVSSFEALQEYSESDLGRKYSQIAPRFQSEALWADFWLSKIKDQATRISQ